MTYKAIYTKKNVVEIFHPRERYRETKQLLQFYRGDCIDIDFLYKDECGHPVDVTNNDISMYVYDDKGNIACEFSMNTGNITIENGLCGYFKLQIEPSESENLNCGYNVFSIALSVPCTHTILNSRFEILEQVSTIDVLTDKRIV